MKKLPPASKAKKMNGLPSATGASPEGNYFVNTMGLRRPFIFKSETVYNIILQTHTQTTKIRRMVNYISKNLKPVLNISKRYLYWATKIVLK